ncbi:hypothetical protein HDV01_004258 [Terramyces sp. JEL0728]|nr:hypothetical protein HDV01_004258 [Terramyces sp. JEL0728]
MKAFVKSNLPESGQTQPTKTPRKLRDISKIKITIEDGDFGSQDTIYSESPKKSADAMGSKSTMGSLTISPTNRRNIDIEAQLDKMDQFAQSYLASAKTKPRPFKKPKHLSNDTIERNNQTKIERETLSDSKLNLPNMKQAKSANSLLKYPITAATVDISKPSSSSQGGWEYKRQSLDKPEKSVNIKFPTIVQKNGKSAGIKVTPNLSRIIEAKELSRFSKRKWMQLLYYYQLLRKVSKFYRKISKSLSDVISALPSVDSEMVTIAHIHTLISNQMLSNQVKQFLVEPQYKRRHENLIVLQNLLYQKVDGFAKYPMHQRLYLCNIMSLESFPKLYLLNSCDIFGNECLFSDVSKRLYCAATTEKSLLIKIEKEEAQEEKQLIYKTLSETVFKGYEQALQLMSRNFTNTKIVAEHAEITELLFIVKGECTVTRELPFLRNEHLKVLEPCGFDYKSNPNYIVVTVDILELQPGTFFPNIPKIGENSNESNFRKEQYYDLFNSMEFKDSHNYHNTGLVAKGKCRIASICIQDFLQMIPEPLLYKMSMNNNVFLQDLTVLQDKYLAENSH